MIENPWSYINLDDPTGILVLEKDRDIINRNNDRLYNDYSDDDYVDLKCFPEPFIGNKDAEIYFLLANPGRGKKDQPEPSPTPEQLEILKESIELNLLHKDQPFPFYYLNPLLKDTSGYNWWRRCLDPLMKTLNLNEDDLAKNLFNVELYGYHSYSVNYYLLRDKIDSLTYTVALVNEAMAKHKLILIGRSVRNWFNLVPDLNKYDNCFFVANERRMILNEVTLSPPVLQKMSKIFLTS